MTTWNRVAALILAGSLAVAPAFRAQSQSLPSPAPIETVPLPAPSGPAATQPPVTVTQPPVAAQPPAATAQLGRVARPTLAPNPGDPNDVDELVLVGKPALVVTGSSSWDDGLKNLRAAIARIEAELGKAGMAPAGRPLALFAQTTDDNFRFEAMVPVERLPDPAPGLPSDMRFGQTPAGKAYRFVHRGAYEDIDSTYETITAYLDAKDVVAKDAFIEEYLDDIADPANTNFEANIYVQPK